MGRVEELEKCPSFCVGVLLVDDSGEVEVAEDGADVGEDREVRGESDGGAVEVGGGVDEVVEVWKYKKVANRTKPVATTLPEEYRIVRYEPPNPLATMSQLPVVPPEFTPMGRYTQERYEAMEVDPSPNGAISSVTVQPSGMIVILFVA